MPFLSRGTPLDRALVSISIIHGVVAASPPTIPLNAPTHLPTAAMSNLADFLNDEEMGPSAAAAPPSKSATNPTPIMTLLPQKPLIQKTGSLQPVERLPLPILQAPPNESRTQQQKQQHPSNQYQNNNQQQLQPKLTTPTKTTTPGKAKRQRRLGTDSKPPRLTAEQRFDRNMVLGAVGQKIRMRMVQRGIDG